MQAKHLSSITGVRKMDEGIVGLQRHWKNGSLMYSASPAICQLALTFSKHIQDTQNMMFKRSILLSLYQGTTGIFHLIARTVKFHSFICCAWEDSVWKPILTTTFLLSSWVPELNFLSVWTRMDLPNPQRKKKDICGVSNYSCLSHG